MLPSLSRVSFSLLGPLGLFLGYSLVASVMLSVMLCVGEVSSHALTMESAAVFSDLSPFRQMVTLFPVSGGHIRLAGRFVDPALSVIVAYNYWICWSLILAAEISGR